MQSSADQMNCCTCINNMTEEKLNYITDDINNTLTDSKGNELFAEYLAGFEDPPKCLRLYNICTNLAEEQTKEQTEEQTEEQAVKSLTDKIKEVKELVRKTPLNSTGDYDLMKKFTEALRKNTKEELLKELLNVLNLTKEQCRKSLLKIYKYFVRHIVEHRNTLT